MTPPRGTPVEARRAEDAGPQIAAQKIEGPLVVTGLPHTGTTTLIDLLAQDLAVRAPLSWKTVIISQRQITRESMGAVIDL
jgi:hypothetical protein